MKPPALPGVISHFIFLLDFLETKMGPNFGRLRLAAGCRQRDTQMRHIWREDPHFSGFAGESHFLEKGKSEFEVSLLGEHTGGHPSAYQILEGILLVERLTAISASRHRDS